MNKIVVEEIDLDIFQLGHKNIGVNILRLDMQDAISGGNKSFKLKYNLQTATEKGKSTLVTFGGAFSNHIAATARTCKLKNLKAVGIIRGEIVLPLNNTLNRAVNDGMLLIPVSRQWYKQIHDSKFCKSDVVKNLLLANDINPDDGYIVPEGGNNTEGYKGCTEILTNVITEYDAVICAVGTGTTLAGIAASVPENKSVHGIAVVNAAESLTENIQLHLAKTNTNSNYIIHHQYTFGGFGKSNAALKAFCELFTQKTNILIEPVYTGKLFYAIFDMIAKDQFYPETKILAIHTGGCQYMIDK
ncbi:MAG TPA: pyridoxal-phosphate dependent enzyme [Bacteroidia bacterium]|jgi:1-aminocyclopropane-1-carboxylate deaminase|nr:pyridoxal-phosphate dependent enzyme [Bacteroidia bacterium]HMU18696.1 pyridoxal-phosphate dependent enzyme [Bacteroidia bacterium]